MRIRCSTQFDITQTNVTGHYKPSRIPFDDFAGNKITDITEWNRSRNQQRNWETLMQLISLRTQVTDLSAPQVNNGVWTFEFSIDNDSLFEQAGDLVGVLKQDCEHVPMLAGLGEQCLSDAVLRPGENIWFEPVPVNIL